VKVIVLTSSWRLTSTTDEIASAISAKGASVKIIGSTSRISGLTDADADEVSVFLTGEKG